METTEKFYDVENHIEIYEKSHPSTCTCYDLLLNNCFWIFLFVIIIAIILIIIIVTVISVNNLS
jgi:hypothetical protein